MQILPDQARVFAFVGATATICVDAWISIRLSLIAVETFAEGRFHPSAYWPLTRGRFWYMFFVYVSCFVVILLLVIALGLGSAIVGSLVTGIGAPRGADPVRRSSLLALAVVYAAVVSAFWVVTTTLISASQAHVFRAITGVHRRRNPILGRPSEEPVPSGRGARPAGDPLPPAGELSVIRLEMEPDPIGEVDRRQGADVGDGKGVAGEEG
jgi:hypothetical protein